MNDVLISIIYFSTAAALFDTDALTELLRISRANNGRDGITGMLLYNEGNFVQAIEGRADLVDACFARIRKDPTHFGITSTRLPIEKPEFPDWTMGFLDCATLKEEDRQSLNNFLRRSHGDGDKATASVAWSMLRSFRSGVRSR